MSTQEDLVLNAEASTNNNNHLSSGSNDEGYSSSSPPATPITQPMYLQLSPTILISITSHTHAPPLQPTPDLKYDLRELPSPDNYTRSKYDGKSKQLREWLSRENVYAELLGQAEQQVMAKGRELEAEAEEEAIPAATDVKEVAEKAKTEAEKQEVTGEVEQKAATEEADKNVVVDEAEKETIKDADENKDLDQSEDQKTGEHADGAEDPEKSEEPQTPVKPPKVLRVGVCCELGRHRSVAFVEELAKRQWPAEWAVEVVHRDVAKGWGRKGKGNRRDKGGRRKSLKGGEIDNDDD
jgi:hypothetical protein